MNKIESLSLTRDQVLDRLRSARSIEQALLSLYGKKTTFNTRERHAFNAKYGVDITGIVSGNRTEEARKKKDEMSNRVFVCDVCGKEYRNGDHPESHKHSHHFCSNTCARKYSAGVDKENRRKKISQTLRSFFSEHKHTIRCQGCGKGMLVNIQQKYGLCDKCKAVATAERASMIESRKRRRDYLYTLGLKSFKKGKRLCPACGAELGKCKRPEICALIHSFKTYSKFFGFDMTALGTERICSEFDRIADMLDELYWKQNFSIPNLMKKFGNTVKDSSYANVSGNFIKLLRPFIKLRDSAAGQRTYFKTSQHTTISNNTFKSGLHTSWNGKTFMYRSSYELDLCRQLDEGRIDYVVEGMTIDYYDTQKKCMRYAVPDFFLPEYGMIIEVKSEFTLDKQNMIDRVASYIAEGYDFILEYEHKSYTLSEMISEIKQTCKTIKQYE